jgi:hypothetical protein
MVSNSGNSPDLVLTSLPAGYNLTTNSWAQLTDFKSKLYYDRRSVLMSNPIWGRSLDFCCCQTLAVLSMWGALTDERTGLSFTGVQIRNTSHLHLQFRMSPFYTVSCQESGSLWTPNIYSFTRNSSTFICAIYTRPLSV